MSAIAVIGLGDLGLACGVRLHELGRGPVGIDPAPGRRAAWREMTGRDALGALDGLAPERALVCVRTTEQAESVLRTLGDETRRDPSVETAAYVITTLAPAFARRLAEFAGPHLRVIELPVSGGSAGGRRGDLTAMPGGPLVAEDDVSFLQETLADRVFRFPRFGDATLVKLVNNTLGAYNAAAFADCMVLAERAGIDPARCAALIRAASGSSWMAENFGDLVDELLAKDAGLLADELGALPVIDVTDAAAFTSALARARALIG